MNTQLRDAKGRFVRSGSDEEYQAFKRLIDQMPEDDERPLRIAPIIRVAIWYQENRASILFHTIYVLLCGLVAYFGARLGLYRHF